jgi:mRNA-degrading endonuclease RelE of RelBE toxin-antitoxin system
MPNDLPHVDVRFTPEFKRNLRALSRKYTAHFFQSLNQIFSFHATSNSATLRTQGMLPLFSSL